jgi:hypothetical protein
MPRKYYRLTWRGFSGRLHKFKPKVFAYNGLWCYKDGDGTIRGISIAMKAGIVKVTPCRKKRKGK